MSRFQVEWLDDGPDSLGRRRFVLHWTDDGEWRPQLHPMDGEPVGHRRAQHYFAVPREEWT